MSCVQGNDEVAPSESSSPAAVACFLGAAAGARPGNRFGSEPGPVLKTAGFPLQKSGYIPPTKPAGMPERPHTATDLARPGTAGFHARHDKR